MEKCEYCNDTHSPDAYSVGYFVVDGVIVEVEGEGEILRCARDDENYPSEVFWTREAAERSMA